MSQEIQLVNTGLPLQPALGPQTMAAPTTTVLPESTPLKRVHQLLRGRYFLAAVLACIGAVVGACAGVVLPKASWESIALVKLHPILEKPDDTEKILPLYPQMVSNVMVEMHTDRVIKQAMQNPEWRSKRPYPGDSPPPDQLADFARNLTIKSLPLAPEMIQVVYDDTRKDGKDVAQVAVKSVIAAWRGIFGDVETKQLDDKIQYHTEIMRNLELSVSAAQKAMNDLRRDVGDDEQAAIQARMQYLVQLEQRMKDAQRMLNEAREDQERRRQGLNGVQPFNADEISRVDFQMQARLNARNEAKISYEALLSQYGPAYPKVIEMKRLLDLRQQDIDEASKKFNDEYFIEQRDDGGPGRAVQKDLTKLKMTVDDLAASYKMENDRVKEILIRHAQILQYKDEIEKDRALIDEKRRLIENFTFQRDRGGVFQVVDDGSTPTTAGDRRVVFAALGFLGGGALPVAFLLLVGLANPRYRFSDETGAEMNGLNLLGILPDLPDRLSDPEQASIAAHCVHQIRTMLQISGAPEERRVFAITSAAPGDGKTSLSLALGLSYAACGARTLLIDCDLVGAGLTSRMGVNAPAGVLEAIANRSLQEYVRTTDVADVTVLPVGSAQTLHASTLSPAALRRLIDEARRHYDTILIDTGPILGSIEASLVCAAADAVVLTVARGQQRPLVEKAIARLMGIGAKLAGVVFNRAQSGDFDRSISGASNLRSSASGTGHNGHDQPRMGTVGGTVGRSIRQANINEG
jgi:capsular exopolysaccharide synthesis family protein